MIFTCENCSVYVEREDFFVRGVCRLESNRTPQNRACPLDATLCADWEEVE